MTDWKKGDIAICVKVGTLPGQNPKLITPPLRLHLEYVVYAVEVCPCGSVKLDVGLGSSGTQGTLCACGRKGLPGLHICLASRFIKKQNLEEIEKLLQKATEEEDFETATTLRDLINNTSQ